MNRYSVNPSQLRSWSTPDKDDFYPISHGAIDAWRENKTLPRQFIENLQLPFNIRRKLFFENSNYTLLRTAGAGESQRAPRHFCHEDQMELFTQNDAQYAWGLKTVAFSGFSIEEEENNDFNRPNVELTIHDPLGGGPPVERHALPTSGEGNSRKILDLAKETRFKWSGCSESSDCKYYPRRYRTSEAVQQANWNTFHSRPNCSHNVGDITTLVHSFDLNASSPDSDIENEDKEKFVHIFSIRIPDKEELHRQICKVNKHIPFRANLFDGPSPFSAMELGFVVPDASFQGSLLNDQRNQMRHKRHDFLQASKKYRDQRELLSHSLPPPALPNASQRYNFAACYQDLIEQGVWQRFLTDNPTPKPASNPGISLSLSLSLSQAE